MVIATLASYRSVVPRANSPLPLSLGIRLASGREHFREGNQRLISVIFSPLGIVINDMVISYGGIAMAWDKPSCKKR